MQVILLQDVAKVGRRYELKTVADGFGRNFLLGRKLALAATPANLKQLENWRAAQAVEERLKSELLEKSLNQLAGITVNLTATTNSEGHLFAAIHLDTIAAALKQQYHLDLPVNTLSVDSPVKTVGDHPIKVKIGQTAGQFLLRVSAAV